MQDSEGAVEVPFGALIVYRGRFGSYGYGWAVGATLEVLLQGFSSQYTLRLCRPLSVAFSLRHDPKLLIPIRVLVRQIDPPDVNKAAQKIQC